MTGERSQIVISKANVVKEIINQLLMHLGANNDVNAIIQKMEELDGSIADLDNYIYNGYVDGGSNREQKPLNPSFRLQRTVVRPIVVEH